MSIWYRQSIPVLPLGTHLQIASAHRTLLQILSIRNCCHKKPRTQSEKQMRLPQSKLKQYFYRRTWKERLLFSRGRCNKQELSCLPFSSRMKSKKSRSGGHIPLFALAQSPSEDRWDKLLLLILQQFGLELFSRGALECQETS